MNKHQLILIIAGVVLVIAIYQLPRVVVENEGEETSTVQESTSHGMTITEIDKQIISDLSQQIKLAEESKKSIKFADSLAHLFLKYQLLDSVRRYAELILERATDDEDIERVALIYYTGFQQSLNEAQASEFGEKSGQLLTDLLAKEPDNYFLKNKLAMLTVATDAPMNGIMMLREILENDPGNREAILNLGVLAIRSGQYDRALERFGTLIKVDSTDYEAMFYLGVTLAESGQKSESIEVMKQVIDGRNVDPAIREMAASYLEN